MIKVGSLKLGKWSYVVSGHYTGDSYWWQRYVATSDQYGDTCHYVVSVYLEPNAAQWTAQFTQELRWMENIWQRNYGNMEAGQNAKEAKKKVDQFLRRAKKLLVFA